MRRSAFSFLVLTLLSAMPVFAGSIITDSKMVFAERQSRDVRVVMYMTSW